MLDLAATLSNYVNPLERRLVHARFMVRRAIELGMSRSIVTRLKLIALKRADEFDAATRDSAYQQWFLADDED